MREGDIVARYGGEEVVVLLNGRSKKEAVAEAELIRETIKDRPLSFRRHAANITVSIGVASYPDDGSDARELLARAASAAVRAGSWAVVEVDPSTPGVAATVPGCGTAAGTLLPCS